ncbi:MAG: M24 family metallopeptidase, partial [Myxococcota bacterium]
PPPRGSRPPRRPTGPGAPPLEPRPTSRTFLVGQVDESSARLVAATKAAMWAGVRAVGPQARLGDVGAAILEVAERAGFSVVRSYCGHGIGRRMHMPPSVPHFGVKGRGLRLRPGMAFTIEPMLNAGSELVVEEADGWTVRTADGERSAQFEHTVLVTETGVEVLTALEARSSSH